MGIRKLIKDIRWLIKLERESREEDERLGVIIDEEEVEANWKRINDVWAQDKADFKKLRQEEWRKKREDLVNKARKIIQRNHR